MKKNRILEFKEKSKFIDEDDVADNIKFILNPEGDLIIRSTTLQASDRRLELDKQQIERLVKFLKPKPSRLTGDNKT